MGNSNRTLNERWTVFYEVTAALELYGIVIVASTLAYVSYRVHQMHVEKTLLWEFTGVLAILVLLLMWLVLAVTF